MLERERERETRTYTEWSCYTRKTWVFGTRRAFVAAACKIQKQKVWLCSKKQGLRIFCSFQNYTLLQSTAQVARLKKGPISRVVADSCSILQQHSLCKRARCTLMLPSAQSGRANWWWLNSFASFQWSMVPLFPLAASPIVDLPLFLLAIKLIFADVIPVVVLNGCSLAN